MYQCICITTNLHTRNTNMGLSRLYMQPPNDNFQVLLTVCTFITQQRSREYFNLLFLLSCNFNNFVTVASTRLRRSEGDADALKHVAALTIYTILLIYRIFSNLIRTHFYTFRGLKNQMRIIIACGFDLRS